MRSTNRSGAGFSLLELLLASSLGLILFGVGMTLLMGDAKRSAAMAAALQGRRWQRRTLALIQADLARAASWQIDPEPSISWPCALAGRHPRLVIKPRDGAVRCWCVADRPTAWRGSLLRGLTRTESCWMGWITSA